MSEEKALSPEEEIFNEWLQHPMTKRMREVARKNFEELKDTWASGGFSAETEFLRATKEANALGKCEVLWKIVRLEYSDIEETKDE